MADQLFRLRHRLGLQPSASPRLVHVVVNDASRSTLGLPSWDRAVFARVFDLLRESEARTIACDIFFTDAGLEENDRLLIDALRRSMNVVMPVLVHPAGALGSNDTTDAAARREQQASRASIHPRVIRGGDPPDCVEVIPSLAEFAAGAAAFGHINASPDPDGVNRRVPLLYRFGGGYVPALSLAAAMRYFGVPETAVEIVFGSHIILHGATTGDGVCGDVRIPIDGNGRMMLDIPGPWEDSFASFPVQNLISTMTDDRYRSHLYDLVEGALVVVSDVSTANRDHGPGIFESVYPLSGLHVTALNSMLTQEFLTGSTPLVSALLGVALALLLWLGSVWFSSRTFPLFGLAVFIAFLVACAALFIATRRIAPMAELTIAMALAVTMVQAGRAVSSRRSYGGRPVAGEALSRAAPVLGAPGAAVPAGDLRTSPERFRAERRERVARYRERVPRNLEAFAEIVTCSPLMLSRFRDAEDFARSDNPVLLTGESGVGKELLAGAIHRLSGRNGKFVTENIAGLDDAMITDTLFGHSRGAFTDAEGMRRGLVEEAHGGTLFLDEIGDMSTSLQVKLLRFIEEKEYRALGSDEVRRSDARIIIATNVDLEQRLREGRFRRDLFYRLTYRIDLPPLRDRRQDIPILIRHFVARFAASAGREPVTLSEDLTTLLQAYPFPGNVRELKNLVENACSRCQAGVLSAASFARELRAGLQTAMADDGSYSGSGLVEFPGAIPTLAKTEELLVAETLRRTQGNQSMAARLLGLSPSALSRRLKRAGGKGAA